MIIFLNKILNNAIVQALIIVMDMDNVMIVNVFANLDGQIMIVL